MHVSDMTDLVREHLAAGETLIEEDSDSYGDRMLTISTSAAVVHGYTLGDEMYALATLDALEAWRPEDAAERASRSIDAILGYARRNGAPPPDAIDYTARRPQSNLDGATLPRN